MSDLKLAQHLAELRNRLIIIFIMFIFSFMLSYAYVDVIYKFLSAPLHNLSDKSMIYTSLTEAFFTNIKLSLYFAFCITFPVLAYQIYKFIAPGLFKKEKKVALLYFISCPILFLMGACLVYFYVMPLAWEFFLSFQNESIRLEAKVNEYLDLCINLILGFGIAFQMPIILILLCQLGLINSQYLRQYRRHAIVFIFIISAVLTPPDIISQIALAIPLLLLYEVSILICTKISNQRCENV